MHIAGIDMSKQRVFMTMVTAAEALVSSFLDLTRILEYVVICTRSPNLLQYILCQNESFARTHHLSSTSIFASLMHIMDTQQNNNMYYLISNKRTLVLETYADRISCIEY